MISVDELHEEWMQDPSYRAEYEAQEEEFALARAMIEARIKAGITQEELARRMHTTQSTVAHLESGKANPSTKTLKRIAKATGTHLRIRFA